MTDKTTPEHHAEAILRAATPAAYLYERKARAAIAQAQDPFNER
jgi:hypothetical protein